MAATAASIITAGPSWSGKPWPRLMAPVRSARADISAKMVTPNSRSREARTGAAGGPGGVGRSSPRGVTGESYGEAPSGDGGCGGSAPTPPPRRMWLRNSESGRPLRLVAPSARAVADRGSPNIGASSPK